MKILLTGASGRVGRAVYIRLCREHHVIGFDQAPSSTADVVASLGNEPALRAALRGVEAVIHTAALHAPHVGHQRESAFEEINVQGTAALLRLALQAGVSRFVYTGTTALYGAGAAPAGQAAWVTEETTPQPQTMHPDEPFVRALRVMFGNRFRHLPVVEFGRPLGIVSVRDALDEDEVRRWMTV